MSVEGVGLHSGTRVQLTLSPAASDTGILFRAADGTLIPATADHVVSSHFATTIGAFGMRIRTVEHLMAAAHGLGIDNLLVDVSAEELPALDGSARGFVDMLEQAGRVTLPAVRKALVIEEAIRVDDGDRFIQVVPCDTLRISYTLDHEHPVIGLQVASVEITESAFVEQLAPARTYGFLRDVGAMRRNGLARGGSLDNAVVVGKRSVLNDNLRFEDEFVRHKILDLVGDLFLLGRPVVGHVVARNAGHALNHQLLLAIEKAAAAGRRRSHRLASSHAPEAVPASVGSARPALPGIAAL